MSLPDLTIKEEISKEVRFALMEQRVASHDLRIKALENFRWWLLSGVAIAGCTSTGTLLLMLLKSHP